MRVRLMTRWGSWMQNDVVSVSDARAAALQEAGIGRIIDEPKAEEPKAEDIEPEQVDEPKAEGSKAKKK